MGYKMKEYISRTEIEHCNEVKAIFQKLSEETGDFCVVDAYPFGCVVLEWFKPNIGFDRQEYFTDASALFDYLLKTWEKIFLFEMEKIYGNTDMDEAQIQKSLPEKEKVRMKEIRNGYIMQYEQCCINW